MISYELAQKLKDTGFVQRVSMDTWCWTDGGWSIARDIEIIDVETVLIRPSLSKLIEACGEKNFILVQQGDLGNWCATHTGRTFEIGIGQTPDEAVANLYLSTRTPDSESRIKY